MPVPARPDILSARFSEPTGRYDHAVLGDAAEWGALELRLADGRTLRFRLPETMVFEDLAPRLADLDGDGLNEVLVVETFIDRGARLAVWNETGRRAETRPIGQPRRWLAPVGAADLDGDGQIEIAYVETPHRTGILRIVRLTGDRIEDVAEAPGLSNHRIGEARIEGGIAVCGGRTFIVTADLGWRNVVVTRLAGGTLKSRAAGPYAGARSLDPQAVCRRHLDLSD